MPEPKGGVIGGVGGGGGIGQPFVQFCFAPSVVCSVFSVSTHFPPTDIDLDMPHVVPDDSDDNEGDDTVDELHDLGDGDEEEVEDEDIATLE